MTPISCIIPTYKRPYSLLQAISSLQKQTLSDFEILVVDNAADIEIAKLVTEFNQTARFPVRYIPEFQLGLHNARHTGVREARGELFVFTDDDATFDPNWLQEHAKTFDAHPDMAAAGGPVRPIWEESPPKWLLNYIKDVEKAMILSLMEPYTEFRLDPTGFFFGVNMAICRDVLFEVGGFNPDSFGDIWLGDGECGLNRKLWERNMLIGYVPTALVYHHILPQRMTVKYFRERMANQGACDMYAQYHKGVPPRFQLFKKACGLMLKNKLWIRSLFYWGRTDVHSLNVQMYAALTQAQLKYLFRLLCQKNFKTLVLKQRWL